MSSPVDGNCFVVADSHDHPCLGEGVPDPLAHHPDAPQHARPRLLPDIVRRQVSCDVSNTPPKQINWRNLKTVTRL